MVIQSERVWMAGQFVPLQLEIQSGVNPGGPAVWRKRSR